MQRLWRHREPTRLVRPTILVGPFPASGNRLPSGRNPTAHGHTLSSRSHSASSGAHLSPWSRDDLAKTRAMDNLVRPRLTLAVSMNFRRLLWLALSEETHAASKTRDEDLKARLLL